MSMSMSRQLHQALLGRSMMSYHSAHTWRTVQRSRAKGNRATGNKGAFNCTYHTQTHAHTKTHTHTHTQRHTHTHTHTHTCCTQTLSGRAVSNSDRKAIALSEWKQRRSHCTHTQTHTHTHTHTHKHTHTHTNTHTHTQRHTHTRTHTPRT